MILTRHQTPPQKKRKETESSSRPNTENYINTERRGGYGGQLFPLKRGELRFEKIMNAKILPERGINPISDSDWADQIFHQFYNEILYRKWIKVAQPPNEISALVVKEFYANAWPENQTEVPKESWVRGKIVKFEKDTINNYLADELLQAYKDVDIDEHYALFSGGEYDESEIANDICIEGKTFELDEHGETMRILRRKHKSHIG